MGHNPKKREYFLSFYGSRKNEYDSNLCKGVLSTKDNTIVELNTRVKKV